MNRGAFLTRMPGGGGMFGHFHAVSHEPLANNSYRWAPLAAHTTEGAQAERDEEGGYKTAEGEESREERGEKECGDNTDRSSGNGSGTSGVSTAGYDEPLLGCVDGMLWTVGDGGRWRQ